VKRRRDAGGVSGHRERADARRNGARCSRTAAILVAAGAGKRLGRKGDKAFVKLAGRPLISYSLTALETAPDVERTIVVVRRGAVRRCRALVESLGLKKVEAVVAGGRRRQDSVRNGLGFASESEYVLVHDAARPFLSRSLVSRTMAACKRTGAAIAAEQASATVKRVKAGRVMETVPRETVWLAQTPQAFKREFLERAFKKWPPGLEATDDAALLERSGMRVAVVPGDPFNIKITYPADVVLAEALLKTGKRPTGRHLAAVTRRRPGGNRET
jgi:2-C-methyl-D-erythritol 4-phosphate cytidylyltransferase